MVGAQGGRGPVVWDQGTGMDEPGGPCSLREWMVKLDGPGPGRRSTVLSSWPQISHLRLWLAFFFCGETNERMCFSTEASRTIAP